MASLIICVQVVGGVDTRSERYHNSSVFELSGAATNCPFQVAVFKGPGRVLASTVALSAPVHGTIHPDSENSASHVTSRPMRSMVESWAAKRRTSCWRCVLAALGS